MGAGNQSAALSLFFSLLTGIQRGDYAGKNSNVFLSAQKRFLQVAKIWAGSFALGPNLGEKQ
jgi:hypothetical protein